MRTAVFLMAANEVRGLVLTAPAFYAMYRAGGTMMAIWLGLCGIGGIALSVIVPTLLMRRLPKFRAATAAAAPAG